MTLIIKELVIRGIVSSNHSTTGDSASGMEKIRQAIEEMKKEITKECYELIQKKIDSSIGR